MFDAAKLRKPLLQFAHLRAQDPLSAFDGGGDGLVQGLAQATALSLKIDKGDGGGHGMFPEKKVGAF
jgi:hypothetical protein